MREGQNSWKDTSRSDGVIITEDAFQAHENKVYSRSFHDPVQRDLIMNRNAAIRREKPLRAEVTRKYKLMVTIPTGDLPALEVEFPGLKSNDMAEKKKALYAITAKYPEYIIHKRK